MTDKKLSQKERVFRVAVQLLGEKYDPTKNMGAYFYQGKVDKYNPDKPLFVKLIELADVPRNAVFDALRRDPRLNGGKKRDWGKKHRLSWNEIISRKEELDRSLSTAALNSELIGALRDEGYSETEIRYIVHGGNFPYGKEAPNGTTPKTPVAIPNKKKVA